jgi:hypothetical protein
MSDFNNPVMDDKEKDLVSSKVDAEADLENDDPEYREYLALAEVYSGDKLKKLTVCTTSSLASSEPDMAAPNRLASGSTTHLHLHAIVHRPGECG